MLGSVVLTPDIFGPLNQLVNIPKSTVYGAELQLNVRPIDGLSLNAGATYVHSRIADFTNFDPFGNLVNFEGEAFPNTPKWQSPRPRIISAQCRAGWTRFVGPTSRGAATPMAP